MKFFYNPNKTYRAHLWNDLTNNTYCKILNSNNNFDSHKLLDSPDGRATCLQCSFIQSKPIRNEKVAKQSYTVDPLLDNRPTHKQIDFMYKNGITFDQDTSRKEAMVKISTYISEHKF